MRLPAASQIHHRLGNLFAWAHGYEHLFLVDVKFGVADPVFRHRNLLDVRIATVPRFIPIDSIHRQEQSPFGSSEYGVVIEQHYGVFRDTRGIGLRGGFSFFGGNRSAKVQFIVRNALERFS